MIADFSKRVCLITALVLMSSPALAQSDLPDGPIVEASLLSELEVAVPGETFWMGLELNVLPGWHIYWRNAGDAGAPPELHWAEEAMVTPGAFEWPLPSMMPEGPFMTYGYEDHIVLPFKVMFPKATSLNQTKVISAEARWLVCKDICIPERQKVEIALGTANETQINVAERARLDSARVALPIEVDWPATFTMIDGELVIEMEIDPDARIWQGVSLEHLTYFPVNENVINNAGQRQVTLNDTTLRMTTELLEGGERPQEISGVLGTGANGLGISFKAQPAEMENVGPRQLWPIALVAFGLVVFAGVFAAIKGRRTA